MEHSLKFKIGLVVLFVGMVILWLAVEALIPYTESEGTLTPKVEAEIFNLIVMLGVAAVTETAGIVLSIYYGLKTFFKWYDARKPKNATNQKL